MRRVLTYLRRDVREIVAPTSLPDPPAPADAPNAAGPRTSLLTRAAQGSAAYFDTWRRRKDSDEGAVEEETAPSGLTLTDKHRRAAVAAAAAASRGADALRPALRALYETRVTAYKDAVSSFADGYREGVAAGSVVESDVSSADPPPEAPPVKRKRGRPRKKEAP